MALDEQDTKTRFINPALDVAGWTLAMVSQEVGTGRVNFDGEWSKGTADYLLYVEIDGKKEIAAVLEAKAVSKSPESGARQAREYARSIDAPFAFATNGHVFVEVSEDGKPGERQKLTQFPGPAQLRNMHPVELERQAQPQTEREAKQQRERMEKQREVSRFQHPATPRRPLLGRLAQWQWERRQLKGALGWHPSLESIAWIRYGSRPKTQRFPHVKGK